MAQTHLLLAYFPVGVAAAAGVTSHAGGGDDGGGEVDGGGGEMLLDMPQSGQHLHDEAQQIKSGS